MSYFRRIFLSSPLAIGEISFESYLGPDRT